MTFRVLTFVTELKQYDAMRGSFVAAGFGDGACVYAMVDNTCGNTGDPYSAVNEVLDDMTEPYLIVVHQDVLLDRCAGRDDLLERLRELDHGHPGWAVAGTAGMSFDQQAVVSVHDPWALPLWPGPWPVEVQTLDEHFLVIRAAARARFSPELSGFHWYATDLCLRARRLGERAYVIDFPLTHLSRGTPSDDYHRVRRMLQQCHGPHYRFGVVVASTGVRVVLSRLRWLRSVTDHPRVLDVLTAGGSTRFARLLRRPYGVAAGHGDRQA